MERKDEGEETERDKRTRYSLAHAHTLTAETKITPEAKLAVNKYEQLFRGIALARTRKKINNTQTTYTEVTI